MNKVYLYALIMAIILLASPIAAIADTSYEPWFTVYGGPGIDAAFGIAVPDPNNVIVVGATNTTAGAGDSLDAMVVGITGGGAVVWARTISLGTLDYFSHAIVGPGGIVYAVGASNVSTGPLTNMDLLVAAYDTGGNLLWASTAGAAFPYQDLGFDIYVNSSGYLHVAGATVDAADNESDGLVAVFYPNGTLAWALEVGDPTINETIFGVVADAGGNVYLVGSTNTTPSLTLGFTGSGDESLLVMRIFPNATLAWSRVINISIVDFAFKVVLDGDGYLYVVGESREDIYGNDIIVAKLDVNGTILWVKRVDYWRFDEGFDIHLWNDKLFIAGAGYPVYPFRNLYDMYLITMFSNGTLESFTRVGGPDMDQATAITVVNGDIYAAGFTLSYGAGRADAVALHLAAGYEYYPWCTGEAWEQVNITVVGNATVTDATYDLLAYTPAITESTLILGPVVDSAWHPDQSIACRPNYVQLVGGDAFIAGAGIGVTPALLAGAGLLAALAIKFKRSRVQ